YLVWRNFWAVTKERVGSEIAKEIQLSTQRNDKAAEVSVSTSATSEKSAKRQHAAIDARVKWIVTLYIVGSFLLCVGNTWEHLIYAIVESIGKACVHAVYVVYFRVFTEGLLYSFYFMRATILLQGTAFEISKCQQYFFGITPTVTYGITLFSYNLRVQISHCNETNPITLVLFFSVGLVNIFWNVVLFIFLIYHVYKIANQKAMVNYQTQTDLKDYLKKLLRLYLVTALSTVALYAAIFTFSWSDAIWPLAVIDICVNCSAILLSFGFAKPVFNVICLCKC
ncbi:hypothetical protein RFI_37272, partial [Reticulomyxa filosa]